VRLAFPRGRARHVMEALYGSSRGRRSDPVAAPLRPSNGMLARSGGGPFSESAASVAFPPSPKPPQRVLERKRGRARGGPR